MGTRVYLFCRVHTMKPALVILAAGIGSRYGAGIKQLAGVGPNGEIIMDYSIHDAIAAGFQKIVFIIRKEIASDFFEVIGNRIERICEPYGVEIRYAYQKLEDVPIPVPEGRKRPWGTGHAVLCCEAVLKEPFAVINADDYYGKEAFVKAFQFLQQQSTAERFGMVGYILKNTLSDNGVVTRGVCHIADGILNGITETHNIEKTETRATGEFGPVDMESVVSMNFWMFPKEFLQELKDGFPVFLNQMKNSLKDEYLLPTIVDQLLQDGKCSVTVEQSHDAWFGVTYQEDRKTVADAFLELYQKGVYQSDLYSDIPIKG